MLLPFQGAFPRCSSPGRCPGLGAFALSGRISPDVVPPGRCPGLGASALSGRFFDVFVSKNMINRNFISTFALANYKFALYKLQNR